MKLHCRLDFNFEIETVSVPPEFIDKIMAALKNLNESSNNSICDTRLLITDYEPQN